MDEWTQQLMGLSESEITFLKQFMMLPEEAQILVRLIIQGDPEQSLEAEMALYDMLEERGEDVSELRASMKQRLEEESAAASKE